MILHQDLLQALPLLAHLRRTQDSVDIAGPKLSPKPVAFGDLYGKKTVLPHLTAQHQGDDFAEVGVIFGARTQTSDKNPMEVDCSERRILRPAQPRPLRRAHLGVFKQGDRGGRLGPLAPLDACPTPRTVSLMVKPCQTTGSG